MKFMHNIEKSGFHPGEYVGYAGGAWRIYKFDWGWRASHQTTGEMIEGGTLAIIDSKLDDIQRKSKP